jgi:hypothetical protein
VLHESPPWDGWTGGEIVYDRYVVDEPGAAFQLTGPTQFARVRVYIEVESADVIRAALACFRNGEPAGGPSPLIAFGADRVKAYDEKCNLSTMWITQAEHDLLGPCWAYNTSARRLTPVAARFSLLEIEQFGQLVRGRVVVAWEYEQLKDQSHLSDYNYQVEWSDEYASATSFDEIRVAVEGQVVIREMIITGQLDSDAWDSQASTYIPNLICARQQVVKECEPSALACCWVQRANYQQTLTISFVDGVQDHVSSFGAGYQRIVGQMTGASGGNGTYIKQSSKPVDENGCYHGCFGTQLGPMIKEWEINANWKLYWSQFQDGPWTLLNEIDVSDIAYIRDFGWRLGNSLEYMGIELSCRSFVSYGVTYTGGTIDNPTVTVTGGYITHNPVQPAHPIYRDYKYYSVSWYCHSTKRIDFTVLEPPSSAGAGTPNAGVVSAGYTLRYLAEPNPFGGSVP